MKRVKKRLPRASQDPTVKRRKEAPESLSGPNSETVLKRLPRASQDPTVKRVVYTRVVYRVGRVVVYTRVVYPGVYASLYTPCICLPVYTRR